MAQIGRPQNAVMADGTGPACHQARSPVYPNIIATISVLGPGLGRAGSTGSGSDAQFVRGSVLGPAIR